MPPKKKSSGKKGRSPRKAKTTTIVDGVPTTEMSHDQLEGHIMRLREELDRERQERNFFNLEKDKITTFWEITKRQLEERSSELQNKEREMEEAEDRHQMEIKIYRQKVKHLLYEQQTNIAELTAEASTAVKMAQEEQLSVEKQMRCTASDLKKKLRENEVNDHISVLELKKEHERMLYDVREDFVRQLEEQKKFYEKKISDITEELTLQRKNELHDTEERKNSHINKLMQNHDKTLSDMKNYYNDITNSNLQLINNLKEQLSEKRKKIERIEKEIADVTDENRKLTEPLNKLREENTELRRRMTNYEKDLKSLELTKSKLNASEKKRKNAEWRFEILEQRFKQIEKERDELYERFLAAIHEVQQKTGLKNLLLEKRLEALSESIEKKEAQLLEVLAASNLDPASAAAVSHRLGDLVDSKNSAIKELQYELARVCKAHNDLVETCGEKMKEFGIPVEELGFQPLKTGLCRENLGKSPAGLVSVPPQ